MNKDKIITYLALVVFIVSITSPVLIETARADTANVSVKWYIPTDTGITISYPTGKSAIEFRPASKTFSGQGADSQADGTYAFDVTNDGNVDIDVSAKFTTDFPSGVTLFNVSTTWGTEDMWWWTSSNETTNSQTLVSSLSPSSSQGFYAYSSGTDVINASWPMERTFQLTSSAS